MSSKRVKRKIEWTIENITRDKIEHENFELESKNFILTLGDNVTKWHTSIQYERDDSKGFLSIWLYKDEVTRDDFRVKFSVQLYDFEGNKNGVIDKSTEYDSAQGWEKFIELDSLFDPSLNYLDEKSAMSIDFKLEIFYPNVTKQEGPASRKPQVMYSHHLEDNRFADFTLKSSDEKEYQVHRLVLSDRSEYFEKMFTINMQEKSKGEAFLQNVHSSTLEKIIEFLYKGTAEITDVEQAKNVLNAAEEFVISDLKSICSDFLLKEVNDQNALEMLKTADLYNAKELEIHSLDIIASYYDTLKDTDEWETLTPQLLKKIMDALANDRQTIKFRTVL